MIRDTSGQDTVAGAGHSPRAKWLAAALAAAAIAGLALAFALNGAGASVDVARLGIAQVKRGTLVRDATANGRMVAAVSATLHAAAPGTVHLKVKAGDSVKKGDLVAELESPELSNALKREQANLAQLEAEVARQRILARKLQLLARRDADQAEIERVAAQRTYQRIETAGVAGVIAKIDFMRAQDALKSAEIRARHAEQAIGLESEEVELALKAKSSQLEQQRLVRDNAQSRVDALRLRAPLDGMVGTLSVADLATVAAGSPLMTLVDLSQLQVELEIPESTATELGLGMAVEIAASGATAAGVLAALSPEVVKNQVLARVRFTGKQPPGLRQSQRVSARLLIEQKPNVLLLTRGPFVEAHGGHFAYVLENGVARRRPITIGATSITSVEILTGLKEGERVVIAGTEQFGDAASVTVNN